MSRDIVDGLCHELGRDRRRAYGSRTSDFVDEDGVMDDVVVAARRALLRTFRWTGGHADFAGALRDAELIRTMGQALAYPFRDQSIDAVVGIEARGFAVAALVARDLGVGLVLARKPGSVHPGAESEPAIELDWRGQAVDLRISPRAIEPGDRILLADDWIETGSQARTVRRLVERMAGTLVGVSVLVDDTSHDVRNDLDVHSLVLSTALSEP